MKNDVLAILDAAVARPDEREPLILVVGMFCDGTLHHRYGTLNGGPCRFGGRVRRSVVATRIISSTCKSLVALRSPKTSQGLRSVLSYEIAVGREFFGFLWLDPRTPCRWLAETRRIGGRCTRASQRGETRRAAAARMYPLRLRAVSPPVKTEKAVFMPTSVDTGHQRTF